MSEWKEGRLKDISNVLMGQSPPGDSCNNNGKGLPLLNGPTEFGIKSPTPVQFTVEPKKICHVDDILFCVRGSTTGRMNWADQKYTIGRGIASINHKNGLEYRYFIRGLLDYYLPLMLSATTGSTFPNISRDQLENLEILIPPLLAQKAIAAVLSSLDDKIDLLHSQNKTLEALAETLFRQWFIEPFDSAQDGKAQDDWEEGNLGDVIEIFDSKRIPLSKMQRDKMKDGVLYPYYGAAQIMDYVNDYIFDGEFILLGEDGTVRTDEGYPVMQYATGKFWVNNHTHIFQAKAPFNNFLIWNYLIKKNIDEIVTGAVQPKINQTNLKSIDFPKYPETLVNKFKHITEPSFQKIKHNQIQIRSLEKLRDSLLPKLMSGEVRVKI